MGTGYSNAFMLIHEISQDVTAMNDRNTALVSFHQLWIVWMDGR